jgi:hypothetical protein
VLLAGDRGELLETNKDETGLPRLESSILLSLLGARTRERERERERDREDGGK